MSGQNEQTEATIGIEDIPDIKDEKEIERL